MHTHPADPQLPRDGARPNPILVHRSNLLDRHCRLAALVDPVRLGSLDTSLLALSYEATFEFGDHPQYRDQDRTGDIGRRELRLKHAQDRPLLPKLMDEVQNVPGVPSQSVQFEDDKLVALSNELHDRREFVSAAERATRSLLAADDRTSGLAEAVLLDRQVLPLRTAPRVSYLRHPHRPFCHIGVNLGSICHKGAEIELNVTSTHVTGGVAVGCTQK